MKRAGAIRAAAIFALLLPGIALALPVPGPCDVCGSRNGCHMHGTSQRAAEAHSCCGAEAETPHEPSLATSDCECGRVAPPALTAETLTTIDPSSSPAVAEEPTSPDEVANAVFSISSRPPAPPPAPPAYLIDCVFLT